MSLCLFLLALPIEGLCLDEPTPSILTLDEALANAAEHRKNIGVAFYGDWSPWSVEMHKKVFSSAAVRDALKDVELVLVDAKTQPETNERLHVVDVPVFVLLDFQGKELGRIHGYASESNFLSALQRITDPPDLALEATPIPLDESEELFLRLIELRQQGKMQLAFETAKRLIEIDPDNHSGKVDNALAFLGLLESRRKQWDKAYEMYSRLFELYPDTELRQHMLVSLGFCASQLDHASTAIQAYERFLKEFPKHPDTLFIKEELQRIKRTKSAKTPG